MTTAGFLKLVVRGLPDDCDVKRCLTSLSLASTYTHVNSKQRVAYVALSPVPGPDDLVGICQRLVASTGAACVERASLQKLPRASRRDPLCGTIEADPQYQAFLATLAEDGSIRPPAKPAAASEPSQAPAPVVPPIVRFLADRMARTPAATGEKTRASRKPKAKKKKKKKGAAAATAAAAAGGPTEAAPQPTTEPVRILLKPASSAAAKPAPAQQGPLPPANANANPNHRRNRKRRGRPTIRPL
ncbi:UPF3 domain-containing protein [Plasmodiophora brassicae]|uniref:UPF3 domain-containing protein n=1 Tax=Plasmodiophora brassicae TaxID=37360 RepID=A0A0G4IHM7_PLABS|nr:hypothetical protein PBRA_000366 [Plasmodiophora brassicae]SPQ96924.1 unnamed protein product [Plasmodiophora brassicae]